MQFESAIAGHRECLYPVTYPDHHRRASQLDSAPRHYAIIIKSKYAAHSPNTAANTRQDIETRAFRYHYQEPGHALFSICIRTAVRLVAARVRHHRRLCRPDPADTGGFRRPATLAMEPVPAGFSGRATQPRLPWLSYPLRPAGRISLRAAAGNRTRHSRHLRRHYRRPGALWRVGRHDPVHRIRPRLSGRDAGRPSDRRRSGW